MSRVTLADVARRAGVSVATASRALGDSARQPREDLRRRVLDVARELDYVPDPAARAVARGRTDVVGVVVQDITDPYFAIIAAAIMHAADERGLVTTLSDTRRDPARELRYVARLRRQRARAVVVVGSRSTDRTHQGALQREIDLLREDGARVALISQRMLDADTVVVENRAGARALAGALHDLGYRDVAVLAGPTSVLTAGERLTGFREGLARRGAPLAPERVVRGDFTREGGHAAATELLARMRDGLAVRCVVAVNDVMAVGAMTALREAGLRVPDDVAVAGFDDIPQARDVTPALTTVGLPLDRLGAEAAALVLDDVAGPAPERPRVCRVGGTVVVRASTPRLAG